MRREIQEYLDGAIAFDDLPPELRAEARRWDRILAEARELGPRGAPAGLEARIQRALSTRGARPAWRRALSWAVRGRPVRVSPLAALAAAAALAVVLVQPWTETPMQVDGDVRTATVYVEFMIEAPSARSVALAGDFNDWSPEWLLHDIDGDGVWTGRIAVTPGVHQYMFVVDGQRWVTDPNAQRYADDGFGNRNAVIVVASPTARS